MARPKNPVPTYRLHKPSGRAVCTVNGRDVYLGRYNSPESLDEYARVCAEVRTASASVARAGRAPSITVNELLVAFWRHAEQYYRDPDGNPATEQAEYRAALRPVRQLYGLTLAAEFGPVALQAVRRAMIEAGWCRTRVNKQVGRVRRVFRWAVAQELVPGSVIQALACVGGLQRGRTDARESAPVLPVDPTHVAPVLPVVRPPVRAMIRLQQFTGMRPGEVCRLRLAEVEMAGDRWTYRPTRHKTLHRGKARVIPIGPRARAALAEFLVGDRPPPAGYDQAALANEKARRTAAAAYRAAGRDRDAALLHEVARPVVLVAGCVVDPHAPLFSPLADREVRFAGMRAARKSKVQPSQTKRSKRNPLKLPRATYSICSYSAAVGRGCAKAGVPHWHPNQLRHTFATEVRRLHGLEAAQVLLGHSRADVTQVYAERDTALAAKVAAEIG